jgi:hypothetical protein
MNLYATAALSMVCLVACAKEPRPAQIIPLDFSGTHPIAMLTVGSHPPERVIFDSGAGGSIVRTKFARALGLPERGSINVSSPGAVAPVVGFMTSLSSARLGEAEIDNGMAVAVDPPGALSELPGVVSPNAFSGRLVRFEFASSRAIVMDRTQASVPTTPSHAYGGERGHPLPVDDIDVAGMKVTALLDSGSRGALQLPMALSKQLPLQGAPVPAKPVHMFGGSHASFQGKISGTVHVGPLTLIDPDVQFVEDVPLANVGIQVLRGLTLVLDPEGQRSWLLPAN